MGYNFVRQQFYGCLFDGTSEVNEVASLHNSPEIGHSLVFTLTAKYRVRTDACRRAPPLYNSVDIATRAVRVTRDVLIQQC